MTATDRSKAAWARALADPSAVVDAAMTRPEVQAALIGWLPSQPNLEKVDWETVLRETEKGTAAWCAVQILGLMMRRRQLEPTGTDPQARDVMLVIESIWDELRDEAENGNPNERVICKHLTKLGRSPDATDGISLLTLIVEAMPGPATIREASPFCLKKRGSLPRFDRMDENEVRELPNPPSEFAKDRSPQLEFDIPELAPVFERHHVMAAMDVRRGGRQISGARPWCTVDHATVDRCDAAPGHRSARWRVAHIAIPHFPRRSRGQ